MTRLILLAALVLSVGGLNALAQETPTPPAAGIDVRVGDPTYPLTLDANESVVCYAERTAVSDSGQFVRFACFFTTDTGPVQLTACDSNAVSCAPLPFVRKAGVVQGDAFVLRKFNGS